MYTPCKETSTGGVITFKLFSHSGDKMSLFIVIHRLVFLAFSTFKNSCVLTFLANLLVIENSVVNTGKYAKGGGKGVRILSGCK